MKHSLIIFFFLICGSCFSQDLEEAIYVATEAFNANRNPETFSKLLKKETDFKPQLKTKDHYFAYLFLLVNKANHLDNINQQTKAIAAYEAALDVYNQQALNKVYTYNITEYCLKPLGILYNKVGDYTNAENTIKHYLFLAEKQKDTPNKISGTINLAQLYYTIGKFESANTVAKNGLNTNGLTASQKQKLIQINVNCQIALNLISSTEDIPTKNNVEAYNLNTLETDYNLALKTKNHKQALQHLNKIIAKAYNDTTSSSRMLAKLHVKKAQLHYKLNQPEASLTELKGALKFLIPNQDYDGLPKKETLYPENTFIDVFDLLAVLQPNHNNALACYDLSFYVSNLLTSTLTSQEAKLFHLSANRTRSESCINLLFDAFQTTSNTTYIELAFNYAEKNKGAILKEMVGKKTLLERYPEDSLLIQESYFLKQQARLTNTLIKAQYQKNGIQTDTVSQALTTVSRTLKQLQATINNKYPESRDTSVSIQQLQSKLKQDNALLVEYFYGETDVFQFIISDKTVALNKIKKDTAFDQSIAKYIDYFNNSSAINNNIPNFTADAFNLYQLLQFDTTSVSKNVIIITDGFLNFIPFESLLSQKTNTTSYSKMPFVANTQTLAYNTSALLYLNTSDFKYTDSVLGVFPVFENSNTKLTYSLNEAESIDKQTNAKFLMHQAATKNDALQQAKNYGVLHLSTHASSGTFNIPANIDFIDQKLFLNDLYSLDLNNQLVVLSACETGIGRLTKGEGSMNLVRGFQYAGIENILFSLWKINDLSTSKLMASFYKNYNTTKSPFAANHLSKLDYLNDPSISNVKKSPYYWSAFMYYGHLTPITQTSKTKYILFTFIGLGIALLLWIIIRRRKNGQHT